MAVISGIHQRFKKPYRLTNDLADFFPKEGNIDCRWAILSA